MSRIPAAPGIAGLSVRKAGLDDVVEVRDFLLRAHGAARVVAGAEGAVTVETGKQLRALAERDDGALLLATLEGRVCGTVAVLPASADGSNVWRSDAFGLRHLAVEPELRRQGIGAALLDEAVRWAREQGGRAVCVHLSHPSDGLAPLFTRRGFERDDSGDFDRGSLHYLEGYVLELR